LEDLITSPALSQAETGFVNEPKVVIETPSSEDATSSELAVMDDPFDPQEFRLVELVIVRTFTTHEEAYLTSIDV